MEGLRSEVTVSAPGKVILHGEHSVVYGKMAVAVSLGLRSSLSLYRTDRTVSLDLPDIGVSREWKLSEVSPLFQHRPSSGTGACCWRDPPGSIDESKVADIKAFLGLPESCCSGRELAAVSFLYLYVSICESAQCVHLRLSSQLPTGAGLGSSAAFAVCLSAALLFHCHGLEPSRDPETRDLVSRWAFLSEKLIHGTPSGIDNSVCCYGGALTFCGGQIEKLERTPSLRVLLVNTKVPRDTRSLVGGVRARRDRLPAVMDPVLAAMDAVAREACRLLRTMPEADALQVYRQLEELTDINQALLSALGVSHPSLDTICQMASLVGLHGKLTGAGGGGFAYILLPPDVTDHAVATLKQQLQEVGYDCWDTELGGAGVELTAA